MNDDPIVAEIRKYRAEHAARYGHDIGKICAALRELERKSAKEVVNLEPKLLAPKTERSAD